MKMDLERYLVEYPQRRIDSLRESISAIMSEHPIVHQLTNVKLDHCEFQIKNKISVFETLNVEWNKLVIVANN